MEIIKIKDSDRPKYMDLLLVADEQVSMVEKYLYRGDMFALLDNGLKVISIVTQEGDGIFEIKNIATVPQYQRIGYGQQLISYFFDYFKSFGRELYVGTGDCLMTIGFYEKCGFEKSHVIKNFFTDNYDHALYEDGKQLVDMIYLKRNL